MSGYAVTGIKHEDKLTLLVTEVAEREAQIASLKSQLAEAQKDRDKLAGAMREISVYGNKHMPAPEYAKEVLRMMEAENGK